MRSTDLRAVSSAFVYEGEDISGRLLFLYWGRRGLSRFVFDLARAARDELPLLSISRASDIYSSFATEFADTLHPIDTFTVNHGAITAAWRIPLLRRDVASLLHRHRVKAIVDMMPHVWMPFILPVIRRTGVKYITLAHDADIHPGDWRTALAKWPMDHCLEQADQVITLSKAVADRLIARGVVSKERLSVLFHPDLRFGTEETSIRRLRAPGAPFRLAFLGRIMPYKGLSLFVDMVERLKADGVDVACGVFGEGPLGVEAVRLKALGAEVVNRWLAEAEIPAVLARYDALVAAHTEASQSGVVAAAQGAGLPVVATPVGGLIEQVKDGVNGLVARATTPKALAEATRRLVEEPRLYEVICTNITARRAERSMMRFAHATLSIVAGASGRSDNY